MSETNDRPRPMTYREAGVDIDAQDRALARIRAHVASTRTPWVLSELGSFGGLFRVPESVGEPVLVASTDGVGTKLLVARMAGRHDTVGQCLVNHCVNDILVMGARPLVFLDYFAVGRLEPDVAEQIVRGVAIACRENGCALVGGETAEMPDIYRPGDYDLAGTIVGVVSRERILDGSRVRAGDLLFGLPSTGLHTNGYTLARKIVFERMGLGVDDPLPGVGASAGDALLAVHRSYLGALGAALDGGLVSALAHVTGGGLTDNLPRVLPEGLGARIRLGSWPVPELFHVLQREGGVPQGDMLRTFNCGIGMVAVVAPGQADAFVAALDEAGERAWRIGEIVAGERAVRYEGALW
ncbi:MAG: phosphoribosylformylglycinamidine cyclo-ligase [Acidobacteria bacterium]|nr:MAG: phosphoribosylformylglycinamidine cyclo-ligase [Acidobacteriota bacterium]